MKLTVQEAQKISLGLSGLDGYDRVARDGERERVVREFYKLGGGLRLLIGINQNKLDAVLSVYNKERSRIIVGLSGGGNELPKAKEGEFFERHNELLQAEQEIELKAININELRLDDNPIPASVLAMLMPILDVP